MKSVLIGLFFVLFGFSATYGQELSGTWQGVMIPAGKEIKQSNLVYIDLRNEKGVFSGKMREEIQESSAFAVKQFTGKLLGKTVEIHQSIIEKQSGSSKQKWCRLNLKLEYNSKTGYLIGKYTAYDCKRISGSIVLFQSDFQLSTSEEQSVSQLWLLPFINDYQDSLSAPAIRKMERENFQFKPIYFDHDKSEIKPEYYVFLNDLIRVVKGHTDLRVKVTGHTDADGSDAYNIELSKKRAASIVQYFIMKGLSADRLVFDFKGESEPADRNDTPEGKQRNRRVDFQFI